MDGPAFPARWKISAPELIAETFSSRIWKVRFEDGSPAIVKALKPFDDVADELRGEADTAAKAVKASPHRPPQRRRPNSTAVGPRSRTNSGCDL